MRNSVHSRSVAIVAFLGASLFSIAAQVVDIRGLM